MCAATILYGTFSFQNTTLVNLDRAVDNFYEGETGESETECFEAGPDIEKRRLPIFLHYLRTFHK
jgi:hypothetical protein